MKDIISKWWNRKWGNWEEYSTHNVSGLGYVDITLRRISNDGLIQFKKIKNY